MKRLLGAMVAVGALVLGAAPAVASDNAAVRTDVGLVRGTTNGECPFLRGDSLRRAAGR